MSQVIIISNRLPVNVKKENGKLEFFPSVGGLATGLSSYVNDKHSMWIGWPGIASNELTSRDRDEIVAELAKHNCSPVFLTQKQIDAFYNGYSNTVLWPLFHGLRAQDKPGERRTQWYSTYRTVNKLFADTVEVAAGDGAQIWVHDYQLLQVPEMLRASKLNATIGFFLHIPFPEPGKFMSLQRYRKMLKGMLGADLIGFHTPDYVENFLQTCHESDMGVIGNQSLFYDNRTVKVSDFPMGIDYEKYAKAGKTAAVKQAVKKYRQRYKGKKIIVAVDRLDPSKGLLERLKAYEQFLSQHARLRGKVVFSMVAAPSRTDVPAYSRLAKRLNEQVKHINGKYGTATWQPVDYINRSVPFEEVTALFQIADVAFIAPLRDGMNLAAKEYVASAHRNGVLILSETAGAAQELHDALIVNPRKLETVVDALYSSLTMRKSELRGRLKRMKRHLSVNTVNEWAKSFVTTLQKPLPHSLSLTLTLNEWHRNRLASNFAGSKKRLILLDYDGTLVPFHDDYRKAAPPETLLRLLEKLGRNKANEVVIISGRHADDLEGWFGNLPVSLVAEHGASTKRAGAGWRSEARPADAWKKQLLPILEKYAARTPHAKVETKAYSLVWHYRSTPPYYAQKYSVILRRTLKPFLKTHGLQIMQGNKVLEVKDPTISKGYAAGAWLSGNYDCIVGIGDDVTDEELFAAMSADDYSIKVGRGRTAAHYRVARQRDVIDLLAELAKL